MRGESRLAIIVRDKRSPVLFGGLVSARVVSQRQAPAGKAAAGLGFAASVFFLLLGDPPRVPWLVVVLSLVYIAYKFRDEPRDKRHPRSKHEAFREGLFAFGFTSLLIFSIGNFSTPDNPYDPVRMAITMGAAWGLVAYRLGRGFSQRGWRLVATLLAGALPITILWVVGSKLIGG